MFWLWKDKIKVSTVNCRNFEDGMIRVILHFIPLPGAKKN